MTERRIIIPLDDDAEDEDIAETIEMIGEMDNFIINAAIVEEKINGEWVRNGEFG